MFKSGEYGLSKDLDVVLWEQYRSSTRTKPELADLVDFVVVNSELHNEFDAFKKAELRAGFSFVPLCELLLLYQAQFSSLQKSCEVKKFEKCYLELAAPQMDEFITWIYEMRKSYTSKGDSLFTNEVQMVLGEVRCYSYI